MIVSKLYRKKHFTKSLIGFFVGILLFTYTNARNGDYEFFIDIDPTHPHFYAIEWLRKNDIIKGYLERDLLLFKPLKKVNRAEALKIALFSGDIRDLSSKLSFEDVPKNSWFFEYVSTGVDRDIIQGFADGLFHPGALVTRAQFIKMIFESFEIPVRQRNRNDVNPIEITDIEAWYVPYIEKAENYNIIGSDNINPNKTIDRGEVAEIAYRTAIVHQGGFKKAYRFIGSGKASFYDEGFRGKHTASGEIYNPEALTAAHRSLPFGTFVKVWQRGDSNKSVVVRINDRGPYFGDRVIDLSPAAFSRLAPLSRGVTEVFFEIWGNEKKKKTIIPSHLKPFFKFPGGINGALGKAAKDDDYDDAHNLSVLEKSLLDREKRGNLIIPLFGKAITSIGRKSFENVTLHEPIPQTIAQGTVMNIGGIVNPEKVGSYHNITLLIKKKDGTYALSQTRQVSDGSFAFTTAFIDLGQWEITIIPDNNREEISIYNLEVVPMRRHLTLPSAKNIKHQSEVSLRTNTENKGLTVKLSNFTRNVLTKLVFHSGDGHEKELYLERGIQDFILPYRFFEDFSFRHKMTVTPYQADSFDGTIFTRQNNWQKSGKAKTYFFEDSFPVIDTRTLMLQNKNIFFHDIKPIEFTITKIDNRININEEVLILDNFYNTYSATLKQKNRENFVFTFLPPHFGNFIFEIKSTNNTPLLIQNFYVSSEFVIPVVVNQVDVPPIPSVNSIGTWLKNLRKKDKIYTPIYRNQKLTNEAQKLAENIAKISDIDAEDVYREGPSFFNHLRQGEGSNRVGVVAYGSGYQEVFNRLALFPTHRHMLLNPKWKYFGVGQAKHADGSPVVVILLTLRKDLF